MYMYIYIYVYVYVYNEHRHIHVYLICTTPFYFQTLTDEIDFTEGMEIDRGFVSPYFVKDQETQLCELENPRILITDRKISNMQV